MTKVVFIQSVSFACNGNGVSTPSYAASYVYDLPDATATDCINKKWAIPYAGWETNPLRPVTLFYPNS